METLGHVKPEEKNKNNKKKKKSSYEQKIHGVDMVNKHKKTCLAILISLFKNHHISQLYKVDTLQN